MQLQFALSHTHTHTMYLFTTLHVILLTYSIFYCTVCVWCCCFFHSACIFIAVGDSNAWIVFHYLQLTAMLAWILWQRHTILRHISKKHFHKYGTHNENSTFSAEKRSAREREERIIQKKRQESIWHTSFRWIWFSEEKTFEVTRFLQHRHAYAGTHTTSDPFVIFNLTTPSWKIFCALLFKWSSKGIG